MGTTPADVSDNEADDIKNSSLHDDTRDVVFYGHTLDNCFILYLM